MSILTLDQARGRGYHEAFIAYPALGDQLLLLYAAQMRYDRAGEKSLLGVTAPELFAGLDFCDILTGLNALTAGKKFAELNAAAIEIFPLTYYQSKTGAGGKMTGAFPTRHLLAEIGAKMGLSGEIAVAPEFALTVGEKKFGRFFTGSQIAVISRGKELRKSWGVEKMQSVVTALKDRYNFVQIGAPGDAPLAGALDKRGAFPLRQVAAVLYNSDLFVGGIGALMHLARGVNCRAVITYSNSEPLATDSYPCNRNLRAENSCSRCQEQMINPNNEAAECADSFSCVRNIPAEAVIAAIIEMMNLPPPPVNLETTSYTVAACRPAPLNALTARFFALAQSQGFGAK